MATICIAGIVSGANAGIRSINGIGLKAEQAIDLDDEAAIL